MRHGVLEDIVLFANGKSIKPGGKGIYPAFGANGIIGGSDKHNNEDAIIVGRVGAYCGAVERCNDKFWASDNTIVVTPKEDNFSKVYTYYLLKNLELNKYAGGSAQPLLTQTTLKKVPVSFIEDATKRNQVGQTLENYDSLIENNNRRIAILEDMAQSLYREWFVHFRFPGHLDCKFVDSELGRIPEGWEVRKVKDFGEVITGKTPSKKKEEYYNSQDIPFIKTPDMHSGIFVIDTIEKLSFAGADSQKKKTLPVGSISVSCIGTAGVVSINVKPAQTNQQINSVVLNNDYEREFLYFALCDLKQTIINYGSTGATMTNLSKSKFENLKVIYPKYNFVTRFQSIVKSMFGEILILLQKNSNLKEQRDIFLPKLISGRINL